MTVHIEGVRIAILGVGCLIGYFDFKRSMNTHPASPATREDVAGAITLACVAIGALMLLFGDIDMDGQAGINAPEVKPTPVVTLWTPYPTSTPQLSPAPTLNR